MNTSLLVPALQRIINEFDALPENRRCSKHFPKKMRDAVEEGRKALLDEQLCDHGFTFHLKEPLPVWVELPPGTGYQIHVDYPRPTGCAEPVWGVRPVDGLNPLYTLVPPSKQRITLRGGPLDGCWYLVTPNGDDYHIVWRWPSGEMDSLWYAGPDSHGICYYRE